jgi:hypothetical protein
VILENYEAHIAIMRERAELALQFYVAKAMTNLIDEERFCKAVYVDPANPNVTKVAFKDGIGYRVEIHLDHEPEVLKHHEIAKLGTAEAN